MAGASAITNPSANPLRIFRKLLYVREFILVVAFFVICFGIALREPRFLQFSNLEQVALSACLVLIVAVGQALVIIARQIDISVGANVAMSAFLSAQWLERNPEGSVFVVLAIACSTGLVLGIGNALAVAVFRVPAIVATLGTLAIYRGGAIIIAEGRQISATALPDSYEGITDIQLAGLPLLVWFALIVTIVFALIMRYTRFGRNLYALGSNPENARIAGIDERWHLGMAFAICGLLCGLVGFLWGARFGTVDSTIAPELHIETISAVVVGGVSIFGGSGTVVGAVIGALIFAVLQNGVQLLGISQFWLQAVLGGAILATVLFYSALARRAERYERESRRRPALARLAGTARPGSADR